MYVQAHFIANNLAETKMITKILKMWKHHCLSFSWKYASISFKCYKLWFFKIVSEVSRIWKKLITVIVYILPLTPVTPEGGRDKCRINFHTLKTSDTILEKAVYIHVWTHSKHHYILRISAQTRHWHYENIFIQKS